MKIFNLINGKLFFLMLGSILLFLGPSSLMALTMEEAINRSIDDVAKPISRNNKAERLIINIVNFHTLEHDQFSSEIETIFYFSLDKRFPNLRKILLSESASGVSSRGSMFINGTYAKKADTVTLHVQVFKGLQDGELIAQTKIDFLSGDSLEKTLVAILDLEANVLSESQKKIYNEIFRSTLNDIGTFELASSAEVSKMTPEAIQKASGCTRDECATIIGQQLGVDRVIVTSLIERSKESYFLSGKLFDIKDGSIVRSVTVNHYGDISKMDAAFQELASKIANVKVVAVKKKYASSDKDILVVFNLESKASIREEVSGLTDRVQEEVLRSGKFNLIEQNELEEALRKLNYKANECTQYSCAVEVAGELKADRAIIGTAKRIAGKYWLVNASLVDINKQKTIRTESIRSEGKYFELLGEGMSTLVAKLLAVKAQKSVTPVVQIQPTEPEPEPIYEEPQQEEPVVPSYEPSAAMFDSELSIGILSDYSTNEIKRECPEGSCSESFEVAAVGDAEGFGLRWGFRADEAVSIGLSIINISQEVETPDQTSADPKLYLTHNGFEFDVMAASLDSIRFGMGFGFFSTNINCPECSEPFSAGLGYSLSPVKIGFTFGQFSIYYGYYMLSGEATRSYYTSFYGWTDAKYTWNATVGMISFVFIF